MRWFTGPPRYSVTLNPDPSRIYECEHPPLVEMYIGVGHRPVEGMDALHYGLYWSIIRDRFPRQQSKPPIGPPIGPELEFRSESGDTIKFRPESPFRYWFLKANDVELVQVQGDRFIYNWRKRPDGEGYPRYSELRGRFLDSWAEYLAFLAGESLPIPSVVECEIGYVNRFDTGGQPVTWAVPPLAGLHGIMPGVQVGEVQLNARLMLPSSLGSAFLSVQPDRSAEAVSSSTWRFSAVAKGTPGAGAASDIGDWLDAVRRQLNFLFVSSFCSELHAQWGTRERP